MMLLMLLACADPLPPDCENDTETACFSGVYRTLLGGRVEGVLTCPLELDGIGCVTSDADGGWQIPGLPLESNVLFTATHEEYVPVLYPQHTSMDWYDWYKTAVPPWVMESNAERLGASLQDDRGHLLFIAWEGLNIDGEDTPPVEGVSARLSTDALLFYANGLGLADDGATATGALGQGGAINLPEGTYDLVLTAPAGPCVEHSFSWQMAEEGSIPVPIRAGYTTAIDVICPVP
jgi:hypothetical protein